MHTHTYIILRTYIHTCTVEWGVLNMVAFLLSIAMNLTYIEFAVLEASSKAIIVNTCYIADSIHPYIYTYIGLYILGTYICTHTYIGIYIRACVMC